MHLYTNLVLNAKQSNIVNCFEMTRFNVYNFNLHNILCIFLEIHHMWCSWYSHVFFTFKDNFSFFKLFNTLFIV